MDVVVPVTASRAARGVNYILGIWLFISAFVWDNGAAERTNTAIVGVLCVAFALTAIRTPIVRRLNTVLSAWLFISAWTLPHHNHAPMWNNVIVAIVVFLLSLVPDRGQPPLETNHAPA